MRHVVGIAVVLAITGAPAAHAQAASDALKAKQQLVGGGLAVGYGLDHCDVPSTAKQRAAFHAKLDDLKKQIGMTGELTAAQTKEIIGLKTDAQEKQFCTGMQLTFPNMLAGFLADKPVSEWGKGAAPAQAAEAATPSPAKAIGDWEIGPVPDVPGACQIARSYHDKEDGGAENAIVIRKTGTGYVMALSYAKWNWTAGEKTSAALVTPDDVVDRNAAWTADATGKVLVTQLPLDKQATLGKTEELTVKFPDGDAEFEVPKLAEALGAMNTCVKSK